MRPSEQRSISLPRSCSRWPDASKVRFARHGLSDLAAAGESGLLHELDLGSDTKIYDPNFVEHPTHNHLICVDCNRIIEFEDTNIELLENCISRRLGFSPASKAVTIEGHCDELKLKRTCRNRRRPSP